MKDKRAGRKQPGYRVVILNKILPILAALVGLTHQQCIQVETRGQANIRVRRVATNGTLQTIDHWLVYRVFDLQSDDVQHEIDLKDIFSRYSFFPPFVYGGYFPSDDVAYLIFTNIMLG